MSKADGSISDPDAALAALGAELAAQVRAAVAGWVVRCVDARVPAHHARRAAVLAEAAAAGEDAARDVGARLDALMAAPVDAQHSTPLQVVRRAVSYPTAVLHRAAAAPAERDRFKTDRFPDDPYDLTPASLEALDPALAEPALTWGAAKAFAHRRRHEAGGGEH